MITNKKRNRIIKFIKEFVEAFYMEFIYVPEKPIIGQFFTENGKGWMKCQESRYALFKTYQLYSNGGMQIFSVFLKSRDNITYESDPVTYHCFEKGGIGIREGIAIEWEGDPFKLGL